MKRLVCAASLFTLLPTLPSVATESLSACQTQACQAHFERFKRTSMRGNHAAQTTLAQFYFHGYGTVQDTDKALKLFKRTARHGDPVAQYYAGLILIGMEGSADFDEGLVYLKKAAIKQHRNAVLLLGLIYLDKKRGEVDLSAADFYLSQAFTLGHPEWALAESLIADTAHVRMSDLPTLDRAMQQHRGGDTGRASMPSVSMHSKDDLFNKMLLSMRQRRTATTTAMQATFCGDQSSCFDNGLQHSLAWAGLQSLN